MKKKQLAVLVFAVVVLSPILVALLVLALVLLFFYTLGVAARGAIAQATFNGLHRRLLAQLHEIGAPPPEREMDESYGCSNPNHASECTPRTCAFKQDEEYWRLYHACEQEHVPEWRICWAA